jgi:molybdate transport system substrate-binding protein
MKILIEDGYVIEKSQVELAESIIGMAVRAGQPLPDISSVEHLKNLLLQAKSIAYSASTSGTYLSNELFQRLEIADQIQDKCIRVVGERVGAVVARGEAEIGFQQVSELLPINGITYVGPIPNEVQYVTTYSVAITAKCKNLKGAREFIDYITSPQAAKVIAKTGLEPKNR